MSSASRIHLETPNSATADWEVRGAHHGDVTSVALAIAELLGELGGTAPPSTALESATRALIDNEAAGTVLVASAPGALVGVLAASWQTAIHVPGRYGLIQDLWVAPHLRSQSVGAALIAALCEQAREQGMTRIEVGLPRESYAGIAATQAFYERENFALLGIRMRRILT